MGRIRTKQIKSMSFELVKKFPDRFTSDFDRNKSAINDMKLVEDKLIRNKISGYIIRIVKRKKTGKKGKKTITPVKVQLKKPY